VIDLVVFGGLLGSLAFVGGVLRKRRRARFFAALMEAPDVPWDGNHGRPVAFDRPWLRAGRPDLRLNAFVGSVTFAEEVRADSQHGSGALLVAADIRDTVGLTWPNEGATKDLRKRVAWLTPRLVPLAERLRSIDDFHPPGGHGFCHAAAGQGINNAEDLVQAFVDLVWILTGDPVEVLTSLCDRAKSSEWDLGVDAAMLFRFVPTDPLVVALAHTYLNSSEPLVAIMAAGVVGSEAIGRVRGLALDPAQPPTVRGRATEVAWRIAPEARGDLVLELLGEPAPAPSAALLERVAKVGLGELGPALATAAVRHWSALGVECRIKAVEQLAHFSDTKTAELLIEHCWRASPVQLAACHGIRTRRLSAATPTILKMLSRAREPEDVELAVNLLANVGTLDGVVALTEARDRLGWRHREPIDLAIAQIQDRHGGDAGGLALVGDDVGGQLSVSSGEAGGALSVPGDEAGGALSVPGEEAGELSPSGAALPPVD
jgi:hypothetical protein